MSATSLRKKLVSIAVIFLMLLAIPIMFSACGGSNTGTTSTNSSPYTAWSPTGNLITIRQEHTATLLQNGKVLVTGGQDSSSNSLSSAELYDPVSGIWSPTGNLITARYNHTSTLLQNSKVLVSGGTDNSNSLSSAELYG